MKLVTTNEEEARGARKSSEYQRRRGRRTEMRGMLRVYRCVCPTLTRSDSALSPPVKTNPTPSSPSHVPCTDKRGRQRGHPPFKKGCGCHGNGRSGPSPVTRDWKLESLYSQCPRRLLLGRRRGDAYSRSVLFIQTALSSGATQTGRERGV